MIARFVSIRIDARGRIGEDHATVEGLEGAGRGTVQQG